MLCIKISLLSVALRKCLFGLIECILDREMALTRLS